VKLERGLARDRTKLTSDLLALAHPKLAVIANAEGVTVVFDKGAVAWSDPAVDLTSKPKAEVK
jgi:Skp family chaperone for outer membrane proteins